MALIWTVRAEPSLGRLLLCSTIFDDPVVSVRDPARLSSSVPSPLPVHQQPKTRLGTGSPATPRDSMVPEVPTLKRQRHF